MKQFLFAFAFTACTMAANAQDDKNSSSADYDKGFHFSAGVNTALPLSDFRDFSSFGLGVEVLPEYRFSRKFAVVVSTGYTNFFGKDGYDDVGFIPVLVGLRAYPLKNFFLGSKLGVGILTGSGESNAAFNLQPGLGYDGEKIQATLGLNTQLESGDKLYHLSFSVLYKFK